MLSVYKDQVPEAGHMTEEVAKLADSLGEFKPGEYVVLHKMLKK